MPRYLLLECARGAASTSEHFVADDDDIAIERVRDVVEGGAFELWRGSTLVDSEGVLWDRRAAVQATPEIRLWTEPSELGATPSGRD
jgi:hypothetical protein